MILLAFDASTLACSACVMKDGVILSSNYRNVGLTHSQTLLPMIESVLSDAAIRPEEIERIGVAVGPGSFTGIKIAVATAKGLAHRNQTPCVAVSSLEALAYGLGNPDETVCAVEDARRGVTYNALFRNRTRLTPDRQIDADELIATAPKPLLFCGDGTDLAVKAAEKAGISYRTVYPDRRFIRAESVAQIAWMAGEGQLLSPQNLNPHYLRPPQAERERAEREKNENS